MSLSVPCGAKLSGGSSAVNQASFNERAAANGLNSGAGSQAALSMGSTLQSNLSSLDNEQASKLSDIDTQRSKLASEYNNAIQEAVSNNDSERAQSLYNEAVRVDNSLASTAQAQAQLNMQMKSAQTAQNQYADEKAANSAQILASITGDYSPYKTLYGWTDAQVANAEAAYQAEKAGSSKNNQSKTGYVYQGGSESGGYGGATASDMANSDARIQTYKAAGYSDAQIASGILSDYRSGAISEAEYGSMIAALQRAAGSARRNS